MLIDQWTLETHDLTIVQTLEIHEFRITIYLYASKKNQTRQIGKAASWRRPAGEQELRIGFGNHKLEIRNQLPVRFVFHRNLIFTIFSSQKSDFHSELSILYSRLVVTTHEHSKLSILNSVNSQFRFTITQSSRLSESQRLRLVTPHNATTCQNKTPKKTPKKTPI